jgi:D-glycero-alpha-D-manno-heptose-7-phosphate kinase
MIITQTPFRMSFFGGGTDMESFFRENGGAVLSTTFDKYCYVNVRHLPRFFDYSTELSYSKTERVTCIEDIQHPAIRNAMKMLDIRPIRKLQILHRDSAIWDWMIPLYGLRM